MSHRRSFDRLTLLTALTAIAAYCIAESNAPMAMVALPSALGAWWLRGRSFAADVPRIALNLILVAVVAYAVLTLIDRPMVTVDDVAQLLLILLVVKLFDRQSARDAAQVLSLSLFLAIGAILTSVRFELGLLLVPLVPMLIVATMQYQIHAGFEAAAKSAASARPAGVAAPAPRFIAGPRWRGQLRGVALLSALGITASATAVFILVPRGMNAGWMSRWGAPSAALQTRFTSTVQLGRGGFLSESQRVVMQVSMTDVDKQPVGGPDLVYYLRGNVLDEYNAESHAWQRSRQATSMDRADPDRYDAGFPLAFGNADGPRIIQHIRLMDSSQGQRYIFTIQRPVQVAVDNRSVRYTYNLADRRIVVPNEEGELQYTVSSVDPGLPPPHRALERPEHAATFDSVPIYDLTASVLARAGLDPVWENRDVSEDSRACRAIQAFLRDQYSYTTDIQAAPAGRDPIEWFLLDQKEGHCEYFASAMAAMCRSVGIPARVVAGYVAAEWNETTGDYVVRESNAHAWVEAQITNTDWRTFDPTPHSDLLRLHRPPGGLMTRVRHLLDAMEHVWTSSIVTYDQGARQRLIRESSRGADDWLGRLATLTDNVRSGGLGLVLRAVMAGAVAFALVAGGGTLVQAVLGRRKRRAAVGRGAPFTREELIWREQTGFYPRLLDALERRGVAKPAWSPPLNHAVSLTGTDPTAADAAERISFLYYEARFGVRRLTAPEVAEAEDALLVLAAPPRPPQAR